MHLKTLRCHIEDYDNTQVRVDGVVTAIDSNTAYIEDYDEETGLYFGIPVYYAFQTGEILTILSVGNRVSVYGTLTYYDAGKSYLITGVSYNSSDPNDETNTLLIGTGYEAAFAETKASDIVSGKFSESVVSDEGNETIEMDYGEAIMSTSVTVSNLKVISIYTTGNGGDSDGAMTIICEADDGTSITVRTSVLKDENGNTVTQDSYIGKTITVKGIIDWYNNYQIKCFDVEWIAIVT